MKDWFSSVYKGFIISALISFIIAFFTEGSASYGAYISGYSVLIIAIMMILLVLFNKILSSNPEGSTFGNLLKVFITSTPLLLMLAVIGFLFYMMITYKNIILEGNISKSYYSFNNINVILLLIQLYMIYNVTTSKNFENSGIFPRVTSNLILLIGILSGISSINIFIILKYFTTDGFTSSK